MRKVGLKTTRRTFLETLTGAAAAAAFPRIAKGEQNSVTDRKPNFIIIFTDDQGYADVGCFWQENTIPGCEKIDTPRLDCMADEGIKFTDFYVTSGVCTPSRSSIMTGCYPLRVGMGDIPRLVLFPDDDVGLSTDEVTIAGLLKEQGYSTMCVGKWHLGHLPPFLPTRHGFDSYFGIPYSNDMSPTPILRDERVVEDPAVQETLTERYTEEAVRFITENHERPFFLYLAHNYPHVPLHTTDKFRGKSGRGLYGDVIQGIDWSTGEILDTLEKLGIDDNTIVVFTSDNGPWLAFGDHGGKAYPLRAGKNTTYEGGFRVPCIMRWPGRIPQGGVCSEVATTMDLLPTFAKLAGTEPPRDRIIDGKDILPLMTAESGAKSPHEAFYYYNCRNLEAVRSGKWKLVFERTRQLEYPYSWHRRQSEGVVNEKIPEALYDLENDVSETTNVIDQHPDVAERLRKLAGRMREDLGDSRTAQPGPNRRPIGKA
jgi:arylsulfatase A-like enzyme